MQKSFISIYIHSGYIVFQWAKDNREYQEGRRRWLGKHPDQCTHLEVFLCGKLGSSLEYKHTLLELVALGLVGSPVVLHSGNLNNNSLANKLQYL